MVSPMDFLSIERSVERIDALTVAVDPEETPYDSKYKARELILSLMKEVDLASSGAAAASSSPSSPSRVLQHRLEAVQARLSARLGCNYFTTEELGGAERPLLRAVEESARFLDPSPPPPQLPPAWLPATLSEALEIGSACLQAANTLALLYSGWDKHARALRFLRTAKRVYRSVAARAAAAAPSAGGAEGVRMAARLDSEYTHTSFYYAQVYGRLGAPAESAAYVEATLRRQLAEQEAAEAGATSTSTTALPRATLAWPGMLAPAAAAAAAVAGGAGGGLIGSVSGGEAGVAASAVAAVVDAPAGAAVAASPESSSEPSAAVETAAAAASRPLPSVDRPEWVRNALRLADFYVAEGRWGALAQTLSAADVVLCQAASEASAQPLPEHLQRLSAECHVAWAQAYVALLRRARERLAEAGAGEAAAGARSRAPPDEGGEEEGEELPPLAAPPPAGGVGGAAAEVLSSGAGGLPPAPPAIDVEDPFSTMPRSVVPLATSSDRVREASGASGESSAATGGVKARKRRIFGSGEDAIDGDDSDHDADPTSIVAAISLVAAPAAAAASPPGDGGAGVGESRHQRNRRALPFTDFLRRNAPLVGSAYACHGPSRIPVSRRAAATLSAPLSDAFESIPCPGTCKSFLPDMLLPASVESSEAARLVFLSAQGACLRALSYFVLDGFVTDHVEVTALLANAFKYLAFWEKDRKTVAAMHSRRIKLLEPILKELNPSVYLHSHKQLSLDAASAAQERMDALTAAMEARVAAGVGGAAEGGAAAKIVAAEVHGLNKSADTAIAFYAHFLRCYNDARLTGAPVDGHNAALPSLDGASALDDASAETYLTAHFCVARLISRRLEVTAEARVAGMLASAERFAWIAKNAPSLRPVGADEAAFCAQELHISKEMATLLPEKAALIKTMAAAKK